MNSHQPANRVGAAKCLPYLPLFYVCSTIAFADLPTTLGDVVFIKPCCTANQQEFCMIIDQ
jgi:hypothetical protein